MGPSSQNVIVPGGSSAWSPLFSIPASASATRGYSASSASTAFWRVPCSSPFPLNSERKPPTLSVWPFLRDMVPVSLISPEQPAAWERSGKLP
ncbi:MAG: hypothetical protein [Circular genetic element sp.]|nr:MAG: hypothetical protein [Circular genetic element sp.]